MYYSFFSLFFLCSSHFSQRVLATANVIIYIIKFVIPTNIIIEKLTELPNVAKLNPIHAIILIIISRIIINIKFS